MDFKNNKYINNISNNNFNNNNNNKIKNINIDLLFEIFYESNINNNLLQKLKILKYEFIKKNIILNYLKKQNKLKEELIKEKEEFYKKQDEKRIEMYYLELEKEKILYQEEKEKIEKYYKAIDLYYKDIIKKIKKWNISVNKINGLLEELDNDIIFLKNNNIINDFGNIGEIINELDFPIGISNYFDDLRIENKNKGLQMFSFLSNTVFNFFEGIEGEELFDPLINIIFAYYNNIINDDNFITIINDIVKNNKSIDILYDLKENKKINYFLFRDKLMGLKPIIFFNKNNYFYLFNFNGEYFYISYRGLINSLRSGKIDKDIGYKIFFKKFLFI